MTETNDWMNDVIAVESTSHADDTTIVGDQHLSTTLQDIDDLVRQHRALIAETGSYSDEIIDVMRSAGLLRMTLARAFGGDDRSSSYVLDVLERVACIDASLAWNLMAWSQAKVTCARLPSSTFDEIVVTDPDVLLCASSASTGTAKMDGDVFVINGEWPFASGSDRCTWLVVHVDEHSGDDVTKKGLLLHRDEVTFVDTWNTLGLRETASKTITVSDIRVDRSRMYELDFVSERNSTLHSRLPVRPSFAMHMAAIALGNARAAVADVIDDSQKPDVIDDSQKHGDRQSTDAAEVIGAKCSDLKLSMHGLLSLTESSWQTVSAGRSIDEATAATMAGISSTVVRKSLDTVLWCYLRIGTRAIFDTHPMQKRVRDALTIAQHANVSLKNCAQLGSIELSDNAARD